MTDDMHPRPNRFAELLDMLGEQGPYVSIEDVGLLTDVDAGLAVGHKLGEDGRTNVAAVVRVRPGSDLHQQIRAIAASDVGGRLMVELTPEGARNTAGRLAVRADEVDPDAAGPLAALADDALTGIVLGLVHAALPDELPRHLVRRTAERIADLVAALARATVAGP